MPSSRQLAAIMFTDIVGYTALMGEDEQKAFEILLKNRELQKPVIEQFHGRFIKELGDGVLATFTTISDAVSAAVKIQQVCKKANNFSLRIGIHQGEVVFDDNDVFGDAVNIASRIQAITEPGSIFISDSIYQNIANKQDWGTKFIKEEKLKNVKEPVRIFEVTALNRNTSIKNSPPVLQRAQNAGTEKSIAVLPFVNMSSDPEQEYFSDGISEEILTSLSQLNDLKVAGRSSSFQFKGKNIDLTEVGEKLHVSTVLEGSVRRQNQRLRITAQLINVKDGYHLWSEKYDRDMDDIFAIQDEIALAITEKLKLTLLNDERNNLTKLPTTNNAAYDLYLRGKFFWNKRGEGLKKGLDFFLQAINLDDHFALAHAGIADSYALLAFYALLPPNEAIPRARQAAEKAIANDSNRVEPYSVIAFVTFFYDWKWEEAKGLFNNALQINADYAPVHSWYSQYLFWIEKDYTSAIAQAQKAIEIEPLLSHSHHLVSFINYSYGYNQEALQASQLAIELDPNSFLAYSSLGMSYFGLQNFDEAIKALEKSVQLSLRHQYPLFQLFYIYLSTGNEEASEKIAAELMARSKNEFISGVILCGISYYQKKYEEAVAFAELAFQQHDNVLTWINVYPLFSFFKTDSRFSQFLKRMSFTVYGVPGT